MYLFLLVSNFIKSILSQVKLSLFTSYQIIITVNLYSNVCYRIKLTGTGVTKPGSYFLCCPCDHGNVIWPRIWAPDCLLDWLTDRPTEKKLNEIRHSLYNTRQHFVVWLWIKHFGRRHWILLSEYQTVRLILSWLE